MTKHKTWERPITIVFIIVIIFRIGLVSASEGLDTSTLDSFLPSRDDIPAEFRTGGYDEEDLNEDGFEEGRSNWFYRMFDDRIVMNLTFRVYKFSNSEFANSFYNKVVDEIKSIGGYNEIIIPSAFAVIHENIVDIGNSWSVENDIVFNFEIFNDLSSENTEDILVEYTILGVSIIPEFPSWIIFPLFVMVTVVGMICRGKILEKIKEIKI